MQRAGRNARDDLDLVFFDEQAKTYYVVEAKGPSSSRNTRNVTLPGSNSPVPAQQGSATYLDGLLEVMLNSGDPARSDIAGDLLKARRGIDGLKLKYLEVKTKMKDMPPYFLVSYFID